MAERGFDVLGVDVSPLALERARAKMEGCSLPCRFEALDFLAATPPGGSFRFVFDRGCFHVFDEPDERQRFAARVAAALAPGGLWLSLIGSTEGSTREVGPPRRSAVEIILAIEPALEIVEVRSAEFRGINAKAWFCLTRRRSRPAQPSTRHDCMAREKMLLVFDESKSPSHSPTPITPRSRPVSRNETECCKLNRR